MFDVAGKVAVVTGASGVLGGSIARSLMKAGVKVVALGRTKSKVEERLIELKEIHPDVMGVTCNVLEIDALREAREEILERWGRIDILINCAGGNTSGGTLPDEKTVFDMQFDDWDEVVRLNLNGTVYPSLVFGEVMGQQNEGVIINVTSMAAYSAITRVPGYSAAKAGR